MLRRRSPPDPARRHHAPRSVRRADRSGGRVAVRVRASDQGVRERLSGSRALTMTRRALIQGLFVAIAVDVVGVLGWLWRRAAEGAGGAVPILRGAKPETATLSSHEINDLVAFAEVLVEGRSLAAIERQHLVDHIEYRVSRDPDYLSLYRTTVT